MKNPSARKPAARGRFVSEQLSRLRHNSFVHNDLANCRNRHNMNNRDIQARRNTLSRISSAVPQ